jgi:site-specific DNA-methyltransferase (adenine-specific)
MTPYYEQSGVTIYHGDCRDVFMGVVPMTPAVFITDPPYGVELGTSDSRGAGHGLAKVGYENQADTFSDWCQLVPVMLETCVQALSRGCVFTGKHLTYLPQPAVVGGVYCPAGVGRNQWGYTNFMPVFFYGIQPTLQHGAQQTVLRSTETASVNGHPCPKPEGWMRWLVNLVSEATDTVIDPFAGSGTTLVAAKRLGRAAIGIEIEEKYCEIAARRLQQEALPLEVA